ncbi:MAG: hypothetical protein ACYC7D_02125 [Nitrososphaerales archaeon]
MAEISTQSGPVTWNVYPKTSIKFSGFAAGLKFDSQRDFSKVTSFLSEGTILCHSQLCAGLPHIKRIFLQALTSWENGIELARNKSLDLLARVTLRPQISEAIKVSQISRTNTLAFLGIAKDASEASSSYNRFLDLIGDKVIRDDSLLNLNISKIEYLTGLHGLDSPANAFSIESQLVEMSSLLNLK